MPIKKPYSMRNRIFQYFLLLLAAFLLFAVLLIYFFFDQLIKNSSDRIHDTVSIYSSQLEKNLSAVESALHIYVQSNTEIALFTTLQRPEDYAPYQIRVRNLFSNALPHFSSIDGMFLYAVQKDVFVSGLRKADSNSCGSYIQTLLRSHCGNQTTDQIQTSQWYFASLEDGYYLIRIIKGNYSYIGAWARLDTLTSAFASMKDSDMTLLYVSPDGTPLTSTDWSAYQLYPSDSPIFQDNTGQKYLQISLKPSFCSEYLMAFVPIEAILSAVRPILHIILLLVFLLLAIEAAMFLSVNRFLARPALVLKQIAAQVGQGDLSVRLSHTDERCEEVIGIRNTLDSLFGEITSLKINVYEERLAKTEFELEYLKSQVAPHFLINCFSTIYSMPGSREGYEITQKMVRTLSDHLRYTLSMQTKVPLSKELHYVENYLELTSIRFPGCLNYEFQIAEECIDAAVFPLLLLMLTENTIKYNMVMGEQLTVKISGCLSAPPNCPPHLLLTHLDSGDGFKSEDLPRLNHFNPDQNKPVDGHEIGLYNTLKRLRLIYGDSAGIRFSNEPGWGARIDIDIPYSAYEEGVSPQPAGASPDEIIFDSAGSDIRPGTED